MATKQEVTREDCNYFWKKVNKKLKAEILKGENLNAIHSWLFDIACALDIDLRLRKSKETTKDRTFWVAVKAVDAWLHTLDRKEIPYELAILFQHVLLVFLKNSCTKGTADRKLLEACYNEVRVHIPQID